MSVMIGAVPGLPRLRMAGVQPRIPRRTQPRPPVIPAKAGIHRRPTSAALRNAPAPPCHSCESRNPPASNQRRVSPTHPRPPVIPAKAGIHRVQPAPRCQRTAPILSFLRKQESTGVHPAQCAAPTPPLSFLRKQESTAPSSPRCQRTRAPLSFLRKQESTPRHGGCASENPHHSQRAHMRRPHPCRPTHGARRRAAPARRPRRLGADRSLRAANRAATTSPACPCKPSCASTGPATQMSRKRTAWRTRSAPTPRRTRRAPPAQSRPWTRRPSSTKRCVRPAGPWMRPRVPSWSPASATTSAVCAAPDDAKAEASAAAVDALAYTVGRTWFSAAAGRAAYAVRAEAARTRVDPRGAGSSL